jgi:hypothetical protein
VLELRGEKCVRVDSPVAAIAAQGWDEPPAYLEP